jgi:hypothetical protein
MKYFMKTADYPDIRRFSHKKSFRYIYAKYRLAAIENINRTVTEPSRKLTAYQPYRHGTVPQTYGASTVPSRNRPANLRRINRIVTETVRALQRYIMTGRTLTHMLPNIKTLSHSISGASAVETEINKSLNKH